MPHDLKSVLQATLYVRAGRPTVRVPVASWPSHFVGVHPPFGACDQVNGGDVEIEGRT
ncbi:hypothetical protein DPMN_137796 [Dreissena polymorpha]|uniref:Uncharacterized protein n=1 Tax=Dreissena polymorpha TaxID=45954 RepID=A0A9D4G3D8_DREPO|nr:hypothetical protein DPMN_137796 [Dreissena polymorpha]